MFTKIFIKRMLVLVCLHIILVTTCSVWTTQNTSNAACTYTARKTNIGKGKAIFFPNLASYFEDPQGRIDIVSRILNLVFRQK